MLQDLRYGARMLLKNPVFTLVVSLSLALGIGANTVVFSLLDAVLLKTLPVKEPERLVLLRWLSGEKMIMSSLMTEGTFDRDKATGLHTTTSFSYPAFEHFRANNRSLSETFAFSSWGMKVSMGGKAGDARGQLVSGNYFAGLGLPALLGRTLTDDDDKASAEPAAVISYKYWQKRFGGDSAVIGKIIYINDTAFTITGVTPPEFYGTSNVGNVIEISVPLAMFSKISPKNIMRMSEPNNWWLNIMGRLKPGVSQQQAQAELDLEMRQHAAELQKSYTEQKDVPQIILDSGSRGLMQARRKYSEPLRVLMIIVGLVLAIACLNVANLLLSRSATRRKEIAVRLAAGASRWRLIRQLLTESLLLAFLGGALGLAFAYWGKDLVVALRLQGWWTTLDLKLDQRVLGFTAAVTVLTGILFGLAPALRATRLDLFSALKEGSSQTGYSRSRLSKWLVVAQMAMSLVLLFDAGLLVRTLRNLTHNVGFNRENLLLLSVNPGDLGYEGVRLANLYQQLLERIENTPGVASAAVGGRMLGGSTGHSLCVPGYTPRPGEKMMIQSLSVGANFFATMQIPILQGRDLNRQDIEPLFGAIAIRQNSGGKPQKDYLEPPQVAVVNQAMAQKYFPDIDPVGRQFSFDTKCKSSNFEIIGIVRDARYNDLREEIRPTVYIPYLNPRFSPPASMNFNIRSAGNPGALIASIQKAVQAVEPRLSLDNIMRQDEQIAEMATQERLFAILSTFFSLLALILVAIGLYGVMSYAVTRRTHEIGVRMALGAERGDVLRLVMRETLWLALIGVVLGIPAALFASRWIASQLFGIAPYDPLTITMGALLLVAVMACAGYWPARKAAQVDPLVALRCE